MIGDAMTPFDPVLLSMLPFLKLNLMLPLSMLPLSKSMLTFFDVIYFSRLKPINFSSYLIFLSYEITNGELKNEKSIFKQDLPKEAKKQHKSLIFSGKLKITSGPETYLIEIHKL